jgi:hypothetical protein
MKIKMTKKEKTGGDFSYRLTLIFIDARTARKPVNPLGQG